MVFSSVVFLFVFLPAVLFCYFIIPKKYREARNFILLIFSLVFYAWGEPKYIILMVISVIINYVSGILLNLSRRKKLGKDKLVLVLSIILNVALLGYFKYFNFFVDSFVDGFNAVAEIFSDSFRISSSFARIALPIGISFYTFQGMSYVIDVYRNEAPVQKNPLRIALYISLFPQLIAGPIVRYKTVADEIENRNECLDDFAWGVRRFMFGFAKKMLLANTMGAVADEIFLGGVAESEVAFLESYAATIPTDLAWLGAITFQFQIYFDFSGYSDMAIGLGRMFGFHFLENFNYPLISKSVTEFWRRWHMSLGTWFRDYVYIPLGGNRTTKLRHIINIFAVWALTGIWHGANWTFMGWGIYFGIFLILEKFFLLKVLEKIPSVFSHIYCLFLTTISWVLFKSPSFGYAITYIGRMFSFTQGTDRFVYLVSQNALCLIICVLASIPFSKLYLKYAERIKKESLRTFATQYPAGIIAFVLFVISILYLINSTFNAFIYYQF